MFFMRTSALLLLAACAKPASTPVPADIQQHMQGHFSLATATRNAVIWGELDLARSSGTNMAQHSDANMPEAWAPHLHGMQIAARDASEAPDLPAAGAAVARMGRACGDCHTTLNTGPSFHFDRAPLEGKSVSERMARHQWAAERMWEGLIIAEPALFDLGARTIAGAPVWNAEPLPEEVAALEDRVRGLADEALAAQNQTTRTEVYGRLLAVCADCHMVAR
jgi:hypothetical protein